MNFTSYSLYQIDIPNFQHRKCIQIGQKEYQNRERIDLAAPDLRFLNVLKFLLK